MKTEDRRTQQPGLDIHYASQIGRAGQDRNHSAGHPKVKTAAQAKTFLAGAYKAIDNETKTSNVGSCAVSAMITPDGFLTVANLGDSQAVLFVVDGEEVEPTVINTLHNPETDPGVQARANKAGGFVWFGRLGMQLAVSRAFGDADYRKHGLISDPELYPINLNDPKFAGKRVFLEVSCDGVAEYPDPDDPKNSLASYTYTIEAHGKIIKNAMENKEANLALAVNAGVIHDKMTDDLTNFIIEIDVSKLSQLKAGIVFNVFDGHSGEKLKAPVADKAVEIMKTFTLAKAEEVLAAAAEQAKAEQAKVVIINSGDKTSTTTTAPPTLTAESARAGGASSSSSSSSSLRRNPTHADLTALDSADDNNPSIWNRICSAVSGALNFAITHKEKVLAGLAVGAFGYELQNEFKYSSGVMPQISGMFTSSSQDMER